MLDTKDIIAEENAFKRLIIDLKQLWKVSMNMQKVKENKQKETQEKM